MKTLLLWVVLCTSTPLLSQTKLSYTLSVTIANSQQNREIIQENFGVAKKTQKHLCLGKIWASLSLQNPA